MMKVSPRCGCVKRCPWTESHGQLTLIRGPEYVVCYVVFWENYLLASA
jgi:hypothetical protein